MNVTMKQKEMLVNHLKRNPELVRGRVDRKYENRLNLVNFNKYYYVYHRNC